MIKSYENTYKNRNKDEIKMILLKQAELNTDYKIECYFDNNIQTDSFEISLRYSSLKSFNPVYTADIIELSDGVKISGKFNMNPFALFMIIIINFMLSIMIIPMIIIDISRHHFKGLFSSFGIIAVALLLPLLGVKLSMNTRISLINYINEIFD